MTLKLKRTPGLYLVGFMGSGKSTIGQVVAGELGWPFVDIDAEIEREQGVSIAEIFSERGEAAFREIESAALRKRVCAIETGMPCVVALGGGAFVQPCNWDLVENNGITVWLDCPLNVVRARLNGDQSRPLARDPVRLAQLFEDRRPLYGRADFRIEITGDDVNAVARRILALPIF